MIFRDRKNAEKQLAKVLGNYSRRPNTLILASLRGGVLVAF